MDIYSALEIMEYLKNYAISVPKVFCHCYYYYMYTCIIIIKTIFRILNFTNLNRKQKS